MPQTRGKKIKNKKKNEKKRKPIFFPDLFHKFPKYSPFQKKKLCSDSTQL